MNLLFKKTMSFLSFSDTEKKAFSVWRKVSSGLLKTPFYVCRGCQKERFIILFGYWEITFCFSDKGISTGRNFPKSSKTASYVSSGYFWLKFHSRKLCFCCFRKLSEKFFFPSAKTFCRVSKIAVYASSRNFCRRQEKFLWKQKFVIFLG